MIEVERIANEQAEKLENVTDEQKQDFIEMTTALGNFLNCIWKQKEKQESNNTQEDSIMDMEEIILEHMAIREWVDWFVKEVVESQRDISDKKSAIVQAFYF